MKRKELQQKITEIVENLSSVWQGTKADFVKFVSKNKKTIKKAAITGSVFALSALMTACSGSGLRIDTDPNTGLPGLYVNGKEPTSQAPTTSLDNNINDNTQGNIGDKVFGGDGQDWESPTTSGNNNISTPSETEPPTTGGNNDYYDNNLPNGNETPTTPTAPSVDPTDPSGWYDDGVHFGGNNNGTSYDDTTGPSEEVEPTSPVEDIETPFPDNDIETTTPDTEVEPTEPIYPTEPTYPVEDTTPSPEVPSVSTEKTDMDRLLSALTGDDIKVTSVKVTVDNTTGDVKVYDMQNGMSGKCVELKVNGDFILMVPIEAYNMATGGVSLPEITGDEIASIFGGDFVNWVASYYGVALPEEYSNDGM